MVPMVSAAIGMNKYDCQWGIFGNLSVCCRFCCRTRCLWWYDCAVMLVTVTSHVTHLPLFHDINVTPSGRLPSVLNRPDGSLTAGISVFEWACQTRSFMLWCRADRPVTSAPSTWQSMQPFCINRYPARALVRFADVGPSRRPTAICTARSSRRSLQPESRRAVLGHLYCWDCSSDPVILMQLPVCPMLIACKQQDLCDMGCWRLRTMRSWPRTRLYLQSWQSDCEVEPVAVVLWFLWQMLKSRRCKIGNTMHTQPALLHR